MTGQFEGKVALVTGGNAGIGRTAVLAYAREGARVVVAARRVPDGEETVEEVRQAGGEAAFVRTDVSQAAEVEEMVKKSVELYGRLDYAFNNAGVGGDRGPMHEQTKESWNDTINITLKGLWLCMKYEITQMLKQGGGAIVNNSSGSGLVGFPGAWAYGASKHGVVGLTRIGALDYAQQGIRVNAVAPAISVRRYPMPGSLPIRSLGRGLGREPLWGGVAPQRRLPRLSCGCALMQPRTSPGSPCP